MDEYGLECEVMRRCHMDYLGFIADEGLKGRIISEEEKAKSLSLWSITCRFCVRDECRDDDTQPAVSNGVVFLFSCFEEEESKWEGDCFFHTIPYGYGVGERNYQIGITAVRRSWMTLRNVFTVIKPLTSTTTIQIPWRKTKRSWRTLTTSGFPSNPLFVPTHHLNPTIL